MENVFSSAIIVAAGKGKRMGRDVSKQFLSLGGKAIIEYAVSVYNCCDIVNEIIIVTSKEEIDSCKAIFSEYEFKKTIKFVDGGKERYDSVYNGLLNVSDKSEIVIVHDGVRPFVNDSMIREVACACTQTGGAVLGVKVKDTIKIVSESGFVIDTPKRDSLYNIQTPQAFKKQILIKAYAKAYETGVFGTDDASLVENMGYLVKIVEGSYDNIKITTVDDLILAEKILTGGDLK